MSTSPKLVLRASKTPTDIVGPNWAGPIWILCSQSWLQLGKNVTYTGYDNLTN